MTTVKHLTTQELEAGLKDILLAPPDNGVLELIVRRPQIGEREILSEAELDLLHGLVGDTWRSRSSTRTADGSPHPDMQLNIMNARAVALLAQDRAALAAGRRSIVSRPGSERDQLAALDAACSWLGRDRSDGPTAHRLR